MTVDGISTNENFRPWAAQPTRTREECAQLLMDLRNAYRSLPVHGRESIKMSLARAIENQMQQLRGVL
jgi:hypothetical protein